MVKGAHEGFPFSGFDRRAAVTGVARFTGADGGLNFAEFQGHGLLQLQISVGQRLSGQILKISNKMDYVMLRERSDRSIWGGVKPDHPRPFAALRVTCYSLC